MNGSSRIRTVLAALVAGSIAAAGCASSSRVIKMEPMTLETQHTPHGVQVEVMDPEVLFMEGAKAFEEKRHEEAARKFGIVIDRFPGSRLARPSLYNRGLAYLSMPMPRKAAGDFEAFIERYPEDKDVADAWQKLGLAYSEGGEWKKALATFGERLKMEPLTLLQEVEIRAHMARGARMLGLFDQARRHVDRVKALRERYQAQPEMDGNYWVAMTAFEGAEAFHDRFVKIKFVLPVERMEKDLIDKAHLFLKAQAEYLDTIRLRNTYWGVKAGVRVGRMYEEFYEDIMNAEVPPELAPDEVVIYMNELKKKTRPLVRKAVAAYERNMILARMYGAEEDWFGDTKERLGKLRQVLKEMPKEGDGER